MVNIAIPLPILHKMLRTGVRCLQASKDGVGSRKVSSIRSQVNSDLGGSMGQLHQVTGQQ